MLTKNKIYDILVIREKELAKAKEPFGARYWLKKSIVQRIVVGGYP